MKDKLLINDIHLGVQRVAGTTPATAFALQAYLLERLEALLAEHEDKDLIVNGDLFDAYLVSMLTLLGAHSVFREWLKRTGRKAAFGRGNHDWSKDSAKLSSFDVLCEILKAEFPDQVTVVTEPRFVAQDIYMIPHMPNQDLFNLELERAGRIAGDDVFKGGHGLLLLHANYDNNFALESDHSLNVSKEQAEGLVEKGWTLVFGHEHQARRAMPCTDGGHGVVITGNQWPSSVADCLNNPGDKKHAHVIKGDDSAEKIVPVPTWDSAEEFANVDWRSLDLLMAGPRFIRVSGKASAAEAPAMLQTIANFRRSSSAFVVSNAVQIEGLGDMAELAVSMEDVRGFDVLGYLLEQLDERQREVVTKLLRINERQLEAA